MKPRLYIFSGLPATGKSTLAKLLAQKVQGLYLRIDTVEQALRDLCSINVEGEGYRLSYRVAADNLKLGLDVVSDSCNPWHLTRHEWQNTAIENGAEYINIEIICSDVKEHQARVENRVTEIKSLRLPSWLEIQNRDYQPWKERVCTIDTAHKSVDNSFQELVEKIFKS